MARKTSSFQERPIRLRRYIAILGCLWTGVVGLSLFFSLSHSREEIYEQAHQQANLLCNHSLAEISSIVNFANIDGMTPESLNQLMGVVQKMISTAHDNSISTSSTIQSRLVSLKPVNPRNAPDKWEADAIIRLMAGEPEVWGIQKRGAGSAGNTYCMIRPMAFTEHCLPCHAHGRAGEIHGGISVAVPLEPIWEVNRARILLMMLGHGLVWLTGVGGLWLVASILRERIRERDWNQGIIQHERDFASAVIETAGALVVILDREGRIVRFNRTCERVTGMSAAEVQGKLIWESGLLPEEAVEDARRVITSLAAGQRDETVAHHENYWLTRAGERRLISWSNTCLSHENGKGEFIIGSGIDVTERTQMMENLRTSEKKFRNLFENCSDALFIADAQTGIIADANQAAARLMGMPRQWLIGIHQTQLHPPEEEATYRERFKYHQNQANLLTCDVQHADGRRIPVEISASVFMLDGRLMIQGAFRDLSERKRLEDEQQRLDEKLQQAQKLESLGVLAGGIAHDFNNLLMGVLGYADLALTEMPETLPARQCVQQIMTAAMRAAELTKQMLAYSGKGRFVIESLDLTKLVEEMTHLLQVSITKKAVLRFNFAPDLPAIEGDATQIRQVIMNLITNASDAIGDRSGMITITTGVLEIDREYLGTVYMDDNLPEGCYTFVEVSDTGSGMDRETMARIFDPFFTTKFTGRGLGLAAVLGIVRGHKGAIKVYSEPGRGTTFKVFFPCAGAARLPAHPLPASDATIWQGSGTILVVDDEDTVRAIGKMTLERAGFQVIVAEDGREAVSLFREHGSAVDLVILDMTMPHMGGEETFRELRRIRPGLRVILSSGYNEQDATHRFAGKGLAGFIQKPYRGRDLVDKVAQLLSGNGQGDEGNHGKNGKNGNHGKNGNGVDGEKVGVGDLELNNER